MAALVRDNTIELPDDCWDMLGVNFDEIASLATSMDDFFDNTKLVAENGLDVSQQPMVMVQPASPQPQLVSQEYFIDPDNQPASPEFVVLQPATPEPFMQQALTPAPVPQQALSPEPYNIQVQPCNLEQLDLSPFSACFESQTASPADSSVLSPFSVGQQEEESSSPAPQETVNAPKKRGRKRKYPEGMAPSRRRPRKPKAYELEPLHDEMLEKKRKNAVNAKKHRDQQKEVKQKLSEELAQATAERDRLLQVVNLYKQREQELLQVLNVHGIKTDGLHHTLEGL